MFTNHFKIKKYSLSQNKIILLKKIAVKLVGKINSLTKTYTTVFKPVKTIRGRTLATAQGTHDQTQGQGTHFI